MTAPIKFLGLYQSPKGRAFSTHSARDQMLGYDGKFYWIYSKSPRKQHYGATLSEPCISPVEEELARLSDRTAPNCRNPNARSVGYAIPRQRLTRILHRAWVNWQAFAGWRSRVTKNNYRPLMSGQRYTVKVDAVSKLEGNEFQ
jgi:hypothetical protein